MRRLLVSAAQMPGYVRFRKALQAPELAQRATLARVLKGLEATGTAERYQLTATTTYEQFRARVPVTDYTFWEDAILAQKSGARANAVCATPERYQPTSGSTAAQKWIPYPSAFTGEMDAAIQAWMGDVALRFGGAFGGSQYWSLSWLPIEQRVHRPSNDDLELLPAWKRLLLEHVMAVPAQVTYTPTMEESQFATLAYLCARADLSLISVWSPTFWLTLLDRLNLWREDLAETLATGRWTRPGWSAHNLIAPRRPAVAQILKRHQGAELYPYLWPRLRLISCWDSASSAPWAERVRAEHPGVHVQGKGLWATEGVITIPFQGQFPAALTSHFLEWQDLENERVHPTWELREGQVVQPLLSGAHGLLRYKLNDGLTVSGRLHATPTFTFQGRCRETDLVGEKLSARLTEDAFREVEAKTGVRPLTLFAVRTRTRAPYYLLLANENDVPCAALSASTDAALARVFHYRLARELGQLGPVEVRRSASPEALYQKILERKGMLTGDIKFESLAEIAEEHLP